MIHYTITPSHPEAHLFTVSVTVSKPNPEGQVFQLPVWIPGSYMVREFSRNIVQIKANAGKKSIAFTQLDKHTWQAAPCQEAITVTAEIYAWDLSVRAAHLDTTHGFYNGTSLFLQVLGQTEKPCTVDIVAPSGKAYSKWRVATSLAIATSAISKKVAGKAAAKPFEFGVYQAKNYDDLVDHPVEMGEFTHGHFNACGVKHEVVINGYVPNLDMPRLLKDLQNICEAQIKLFEPKTQQAPMSRYVFMTTVTSDGYGGLEHRASTALICGRIDLPVLGVKAQSDAYRTYLGLCSHEYFHTWNVKRIKPAAFAPYDYTQENYTRLLWLFEGFTSYYDDLMLVRSACITPTEYLKLLEKNLNTVLHSNGRSKQSVAASSFDAWTKYYRQDENAPNAVVSYYGKGSLIALGLDAMIRSNTQGKRSLDDVMRLLWQRYGSDFYSDDINKQAQGLAEDGVQALILEALGKYASETFPKDLAQFFKNYIEGVKDVPLQNLLKPLGVELEALQVTQTNLDRLGIKTNNDGGWVKVKQVLDGGAAQKAGLAAGDYLASLDGIRLKPNGANTLEKVLQRYRIGDRIFCQAYRHDVLQNITIILQNELPTNTESTFQLRFQEDKNSLRSAWLK